jgi:hypothetical protein
LWAEEERFRPVLCLLSTLRDEAVAGLRTMDLTKSAEEVKTSTAILKSQINFASTFIDLPSVIQETRKQIEQQKKQQERIGRAAVNTGIHEAGGEA